jgi:hypothetical protein
MNEDGEEGVPDIYDDTKPDYDNETEQEEEEEEEDFG